MTWIQQMRELIGTAAPVLPEEAAAAKAEADCKRCYEYRDEHMARLAIVRFMMEQVARVGGKLDDNHIFCDECTEMVGGGYNLELGILLCQNRILSKRHLEDTLAHELVHAYDDARFKVDWTNLRHHACAEIRASTLSGECAMLRELRKTGLGGFAGKFQECIRRRATILVSANPNCASPEQAARVVDEVFELCFKDTRPFDDVYK